jgi:hypothetical protein
VSKPVRRFDSQEYLDNWRERGEFPAIHDSLFAMIVEHASGKRFADLCGNTGLLAQRILEKLPADQVVGIEMDRDAVARGRAAGMSYPRLELKVDQTTVGQVEAFLREHAIDTFVARRCLSEVFGYNRTFAPEFCAMLRRLPIRQVFIQGRAPTGKPTHPIPSVYEEISCLESHFRLVEVKGQCAYLLPRDDA